MPKPQHVTSSPLAFLSRNWMLLLGVAVLTIMTWVPKIPLFEIIPGYIVRARLEDVLVAGLLGVYGVQVLRKKASLRSPLTAIFIFYAVVGILSMLNAMYVVQTLPLNLLHVGKMFLHYARRLEYFSIFFLFYAAIKKINNMRIVYAGIALMLVGVTIYGYGQKYLYWPVYSTMNREFSKGMRLVLTEHARVPSTFAGHYDMAAFTMVALTLLLAAFFLTKKLWAKAVLLFIFVNGFWLLILASSRSSFLGYLLSVGVLILMIGIYKKSWWWTISRGLVTLSLSMIVMVSFGDLSQRFSQLGFIQQINQTFSALTKPVTQKPAQSIAVNPIDETDQLPIARPTPISTAKPVVLPPDVYKDIPDLKVITATVGGKTVQQIIEVPREFSPCTFKYGLSACIRFDTLWPRAIRGFLRNPLLGSGYSTLTKSTVGEFTEAESTDNDFLRNLGETGILGVVGFYGPIAMFFWYVLRTLKEKQQPLEAAFLMGLVAASLGLLFNALYIDVFEASKVAFMYWAFMGIAFAVMQIRLKETNK